MDYGKIKRPMRERLLYLMTDLQWHHFTEILEVGGKSCQARLLELKRQGYSIESRTVNQPGAGKEYRLTSLELGVPQPKRVKVFLDEKDADALSNGSITSSASYAIKSALASFRENYDKL